MTTNATKRTCAADGCRTILRTTNPDDYCGVHIDPRVEAVERTVSSVPSGAMGRKTRKANLPPVTRPGTTTQRILDAMPGTVDEIAQAIGVSAKTVGTICDTLAKDGRATRVKIKRIGAHGRRISFHRAQRDGAA